MIELWDNTKLSSWLNCEQQGFYSHSYQGTGIIPKEPSVALVWGSGFHAGVEEWCNQFLRGEESIPKQQAAFTDVWFSQLPVATTEALDLKSDRHSVANFLRLFSGYKERFPNSLYKPIAVEKPFKLLLGRVDEVDIYWTGILDRIVEFQGGTYFLELKTTSHRIDDAWLKQFRVSGQLRGYIWAGQQLLGQKFDGAIVHGVEKAAIPKTGRARKVEELIGASMVEIEPELVEEWKENTLKKIASIHSALAAGHYTRNLGDACNAYNFSGCPFRDICGVPAGMRQQVVEEGYVRRIWDPLAKVRSQRIPWES